MSKTIEVYTVGHSKHQFAKFAELMQKHAIEVLIDVRSRPHSRWVPWFNQKNLETAIPKIGIGYKWVGDSLGGLPSDPALYKSNPSNKGKKAPKAIADYGKIAQQDWYRDAINKLIEVAGEHRTAIMCAEENPSTCHRSLLLGDTLTKLGIKVFHIRKDGNLEAQTPANPA
jgi:uncharacterized protein (DUF488 family)